VDELSDLDVVDGLVDVCASVWAPPDARLIVTVLVLRRAIELLEQIDRSLASAASMQWAYPADDAARAEYAGWLEAWRKVELPSRLERLARLLAASGDGRTAVVVLMSHLRSIPPTNGRALPDVRAMLRERLLIELLERDVRVEALLTDGLTSAALLSGALWVLRAPSPDRVRVAVDAYRRWCCEDDVLWRAPLDTHEDDLIEALAKLFARLPSPTDEVEALLAAVTRPSQGWGFDLQRWFKSVPKVTHAVIVGAAAAHFCAIEGRGPEADRLIGLVWDHLQRSPRTACHRLRLGVRSKDRWSRFRPSRRARAGRHGRPLGRSHRRRKLRVKPYRRRCTARSSARPPSLVRGASTYRGRASACDRRGTGETSKHCAPTGGRRVRGGRSRERPVAST